MAALIPFGWLPIIGIVLLAPQDPNDLLHASIQASVQNIHHRNENNFEAALAASQQALELHQRSGIRTNLDLQWAAVGENLRSLGRFEEALAAFRKAQSLQQRAVVWRDIVLTLILLGRLADAEREVEAFMRAAATASPLFRADSRLALSDLRMANGRHGDAVAAVRDAVEIAGTDAAAERIRLAALAQLLVCVLDSMTVLPYDEALALARRMDTEIPGLLFPVAPFARRAVHVRRRLAGEFDLVLREDAEARKAAQRAGDAGLEIEVLRSMAATYDALNSHDNQIAALREAARLAGMHLSTATGDARNLSRARLADTLSALGEAHLAAAQPMRADDVFSSAIDAAATATDTAALKSVAEEMARAWVGRARAALAGERLLEAREILDRALSGEIEGATFDQGELFLLRARAEGPGVHRLAAAAVWFDRAAEAFRVGRNPPYEAGAHLSAARFFLQPAPANSPVIPFALAEGTKHVRQAAALAESLNLGSIRWQIAFFEGRSAEIGNDSACALLSYRQAIADLDRLRSSLPDDQRASVIDALSVETLYTHALGLLTKAAQHEEAWDLLERAKARTFLEMLHGRRRRPAKRTTAVDDEASRLERLILDLRVSLAPENVPVLRSSSRDPASLEQSLRELEQRFQLARERFEDETPARAGQILALRPLAPAAIQARLPPDAALIAYGLLPDGITAFVVTRDGMTQLSWDISIERLRNDIARLSEGFADPDSDAKDLRKSISTVSAQIVLPALEALESGIDRLIIVPTGALTYVPFQALTTAIGASLIDRYEITYLPNASSLEFLGSTGEPDRTPSGSLFVGALGTLSVEGLDPLPGTIAEANEIAEIAPQARIVTGNAFTRSAVLDALQRDSAVHLATHSVINAEVPMFSAILTAPDGDGGSRISLYEILDLDLSAKLVVLSACETGLGRLRRGDEIAGLTRTFLLAGADTVVSSLWEVSDDATILLMRGFYDGLRHGHSPARALRNAALSVRERYPHPMYWAPFIVTGALPPEE